MRKQEIIGELEQKYGYIYEPVYWLDGTVMTHKFFKTDITEPKCKWIISIEDHRDERPEIDDFVIYSSFHDPDHKDWFGNQVDESGAVDYDVMKLIVEFVGILKEE